MTPVDIVVELETARVRLGIKKNVLCAAAGIKPEMMSYLFKRAKNDQSLPTECVEKLRKAIKTLEKKKK